MYGYVRICTDMYGYVRICTDMYGYVRYAAWYSWSSSVFIGLHLLIGSRHLADIRVAAPQLPGKSPAVIRWFHGDPVAELSWVSQQLICGGFSFFEVLPGVATRLTPKLRSLNRAMNLMVFCNSQPRVSYPHAIACHRMPSHAIACLCMPMQLLDASGCWQSANPLPPSQFQVLRFASDLRVFHGFGHAMERFACRCHDAMAQCLQQLSSPGSPGSPGSPRSPDQSRSLSRRRLEDLWPQVATHCWFSDHTRYAKICWDYIFYIRLQQLRLSNQNMLSLQQLHLKQQIVTTQSHDEKLPCIRLALGLFGSVSVRSIWAWFRLTFGCIHGWIKVCLGFRVSEAVLLVVEA